MKPFNLEAAKRGDPLVTRGGESVKFICVEPDAQADTRLLVLRNGRVLPLYEDGRYDAIPGNPADVFMAPKIKTVWVNIYSDSFRPRDSFASGYLYETEIIADANSEADRIGGKAWPMEIEE